ncbi:hypothetical protein [Polymorphospora lycopeni]|uniref:Uncharacterized protein n=1 Tax=Polymorphospora lycopeni TaxID=3140240 RepID=A0ABV5CIZ6_9ACTN
MAVVHRSGGVLPTVASPSLSRSTTPTALSVTGAASYPPTGR